MRKSLIGDGVYFAQIGILSAQIAIILSANARFDVWKWVLFGANRHIIGANRNYSIDQCANPSSEMGINPFQC